MDAFVSHSAPQPSALATSPEINDRGSRFLAQIFRAPTASSARAAHAFVRRSHAKAPATHEVLAYRCMSLRAHRSGDDPSDFRLEEGCDDDGEQWAGNKILKVMRECGAIDCAVVVSRWYGGVMLGPARFTHFEDCTREVCRAFVEIDAMEDALATLAALDESVALLRARVAQPEKAADEGGEGERAVKRRRVGGGAGDYEALRKGRDVGKIKRLVTARENTLKAVQKLLDKQDAAQAEPVAEAAPVAEVAPAEKEDAAAAKTAPVLETAPAPGLAPITESTPATDAVEE